MSWKRYKLEDESLINSYIHSNTASFIESYNYLQIEDKIKNIFKADGVLKTEIIDWIQDLEKQEDELIKKLKSKEIKINNKTQLENMFTNILFNNEIVKFIDLINKINKSTLSSKSTIEYLKQVNFIIKQVNILLNESNYKEKMFKDGEYKSAISELDKINTKGQKVLQEVRTELLKHLPEIQSARLTGKDYKNQSLQDKLNDFYSDMIGMIH